MWGLFLSIEKQHGALCLRVLDNFITKAFELLTLLLFGGGFLVSSVYVLLKKYRKSLSIAEGLPETHCYSQITSWLAGFFTAGH